MNILSKAVFVFTLFAVLLTGVFVALPHEGVPAVPREEHAQVMVTPASPEDRVSPEALGEGGLTPVATSSAAALSVKESEEATSISTPGPLVALQKTTSNEWPTDVLLAGQAVIDLTNKERASEGLPPLAYNARLFAMAEAKAVDMFLKQYFAHESPTGETIGMLAEKYGYAYLDLGENLALGDFDDNAELVKGWMDSPGHRANIMNGTFTEIGVGIIRENYHGRIVWFAVQEFGRPRSACPGPDPSLEAKIKIYQEQIAQLDATLTVLRAELANWGYDAETYNIKVDEYNALVADYRSLVATAKSDIGNYNAQVAVFNSCVGE